ncbi:MAG: PAS domain-containing sensor histidine kinase [bacterium]
MSDSTAEELKKQLEELRAEHELAKAGISRYAELNNKYQKTKSRLEAIQIALPDMVFDLDIEGRFLAFYAPHPESLYAKPDEFIGKKIDEVIPGDAGALLSGGVRRCVETGEKTTVNYSLAIAGIENYFEAVNTPVWDVNHKLERVLAVVRDISASKRYEVALKKSEQEKATVLNATSELVIYLNPEMKIIWANKAAADSLDLTPDQLVGHCCFDIWYKTPSVCNACPVEKALKTGVPQECEIETPDGKSWYIRGYPARDKEGKLIGVVELALDISDRKKSETALHISEEKFKNLTEEIADGVVVISDDQKYIWLNKAFARMFGYTVEELTGAPAGTVIAEKYAKNLKRMAGSMISDQPGEATHFESIGKKKNGEEIIIEASAKRIIFENKPALQSVMRDITERKRTEEALIESEARYRSLAEAAQDLIFIISPDGIVQYINSFGASQVNLTPEQVIGKPHSTFFPAQTSERQRNNLQNVFKTGEPVHVESVTYFPGRVSWLDTRIVPIRNKAGIVTEALGISRDITERKLADEQLIKTKKEAEFYLDLMSHDLTNFNQTILGNLSLVEMQGSLTEKQQKYVAACKRQLSRAENLISKVRAFSQVKHIEKHHLKDIDLNGVVCEAIRMVSSLYPNKKIDVHFEPEGIKPAKGTELLDSVLINVIENAVKHTPGDDVTLNINVANAMNDPETFWEISVADNGPGVLEEMKEKIFDRYSKIGAEKGMGLGLSLARAITEKFGGSMWVDDRVAGDPPAGSVFKIAIPKA